MMKLATFVFCAVGLCSATGHLTAQGKGQFIGNVVAKWLNHDGPDVDMEILEPFEYVDANGRRWAVKPGALINGASIPQALWTFGSPYTGDYRRAAVVHDYFCNLKTTSWQDTHRMFYEATIDGGLSRTSAAVMFSGVWWGGPRWEVVRTKNVAGVEVESVQDVVVEEPTPRELEELKQWIELTAPTREQIEAEVDRRRRR